MSRRPLIAVAWPSPDYLAALEQAGAEPRVLDPASDPLPEALDECDGVLLTGGEDVDPARYGQSAHSSVEVDVARDAYEFALTRAALDRDLPLLGICRGAQVLNVVAGGSLVQDLPSARPSSVSHEVSQPKNALAHDVAVAPASCLARVLTGRVDATGHVPVNSRHHQSVDEVAPGFVVSATAPDGVVEAIERPDSAFCLGVQWHPENFWRTGEFGTIFEGFVAAAMKGPRSSPRGAYLERGRTP
jgi:putative glutamine amidotransferase